MNFLFALLAILAVLIVYTMVSSVIKLALLLTTRYRYENHRMILPTLFTLLIWSTDFYFCLFTIGKMFDKPILDVFLNVLIKTTSLSDDLVPILLTIIAFFVVGILLQSLAFFTVNIDLKTFFNKLRFKVKLIAMFCKLRMQTAKQAKENAKTKKDETIEEQPSVSPKEDTIDTQELTTSETTIPLTEEILQDEAIEESTTEILPSDSIPNTANIDEQEQDVASLINALKSALETVASNTDTPDPTSGIVLHDPLEKLDFFSSLISSIFSFCTLLFSTLVLFAIGDILSTYLIP